jgi:hypothetical protein
MKHYEYKVSRRLTTKEPSRKPSHSPARLAARPLNSLLFVGLVEAGWTLGVRVSISMEIIETPILGFRFHFGAVVQFRCGQTVLLSTGLGLGEDRHGRRSGRISSATRCIIKELGMAILPKGLTVKSKELLHSIFASSLL